MIIGGGSSISARRRRQKYVISTIAAATDAAKAMHPATTAIVRSENGNTIGSASAAGAAPILGEASVRDDPSAVLKSFSCFDLLTRV
jgi:hypothetical protein